MADHDITLHIEGHPGHRGNALAHALVTKLRRLLSALGQAERSYTDRAARQTDYEVIGLGKTNPTHVTLHPVPRVPSYDPIPAFNWTFEQFQRIGSGLPVDDRVDATLAKTLAEIAEKQREDDYSKLWLTVNGEKLTLDEGYMAKSQALATRRIEDHYAPQWFRGTSYGSIVGDLRQVADIEGEHQFVILPPIGAERIACTFPEDMREQMGQYLFKTVRVIGKLRYQQDFPYPVEVDMENIELVTQMDRPPHLLELRGIFKGRRHAIIAWVNYWMASNTLYYWDVCMFYEVLNDEPVALRRKLPSRKSCREITMVRGRRI